MAFALSLRPALAALLGALALAGAGCDPGGGPFRDSVRLGGATVSAEVLNRGRGVYQRSCRTCHGEAGDGRGPTGVNLDPPPRDFTAGQFKYVSAPAGSLPRDDDLRRVTRSGLAGTGMVAWRLPEAELDAVIQYLKTFSPRWRAEKPAPAVAAGPDPWTGREAAALERGRRVYHGEGRCLDCHPAYAPAAEIARFAGERGATPPQLRAHPFDPIASDSKFGRKLLAPDFLRDRLRSVRPQQATADLYRAAAAGIGGTSMAAGQGVVPEPDLWALAHYVGSLAALRGTPEAVELRRGLGAR